MRRLLLVPVVVGALVLLTPSPASAHPLGNFTTNTYAGIVVSPDRTVVDYVVDLAEIPTVQQGDALEAAGASSTCTRLAARLHLRVGGRAGVLTVGRAAITNPPGQAGLATTRIECRLTAPAAVAGATALTFTDGNYRGRLGWRELTATGDGVRLLRSDVPRASISQRLTAYPTNRLKSPLRRTSARLRVEPGGVAAGGSTVHAPAAGGALRGADAATRRFTDLVAERALTPGFALAALALAVVLGAIHALAPGHGKTVMAAYLVGQRGTRRQALGVGLTVAVTHTAGVLVLGIVLTATQVVAPERLYPILGLVGGLMVASVGAGLLTRSLRHPVGRPHQHHHHDHDHDRDHDHDHGHDHHDHHHDHGHGHSSAPAPMGRRGIIAMGLAGGMVPSPSALLVLLGAVALGRAWFGVALVLAYGVGMAATLIAAGLLLARASAAVERLLAGRTVTAVLVRALPAVSAAVVLVLGLTVAVRATVAL